MTREHLEIVIHLAEERLHWVKPPGVQVGDAVAECKQFASLCPKNEHINIDRSTNDRHDC